MNQFENETLGFAAVLFLILCVMFAFSRTRLWFWSCVPRPVIVASLVWFVCALIVITTVRRSLLQGPVFVLAYFMLVFTTPALLAAGMLEIILGTYATFFRHDRTESFSARWHFVAALSTFASIGAYFVFRAFPG
jgi:hypothetical protein